MDKGISYLKKYKLSLKKTVLVVSRQDARRCSGNVETRFFPKSFRLRMNDVASFTNCVYRSVKFQAGKLESVDRFFISLKLLGFEFSNRFFNVLGRKDWKKISYLLSIQNF